VKKTHLMARIATAVLIIMMVAGIVILIMDENNAQTTTYEIIAFIVGAAGMIMAIIAQVYAVRQDRENDRMIRDIHALVEAESKDAKTTERILKRLNELHPRRVRKS